MAYSASPKERAAMRRPLSDRFWAKVDKSGECWEWQGCKVGPSYCMYGGFYHEGKLHRAHRYAYELFIGSIPDNLCVLHKCDNPLCVNPNHLFLGTRKENSKDRDIKGRSKNNYRGRMTICEARSILEHYKKGMRPRQISKLFQHISINAIYTVVYGISWEGKLNAV